MRVLIADDTLLLREGLARILAEHGFDIVAQAADADDARRKLASHRPDLAIIDVRMPPAWTDEGLRLALEARAADESLAVLMLSQYVELVYLSELLADARGGIGYLLKDRVGNVGEFVDAVRRVGEGGTALDPEIVSELVGARSGAGPLATLTPRESEVLALAAEGRSNRAIADALVVSPGAVEKHVTSIFSKLGLPPSDTDHRRVLAVLAYLESEHPS